MEKLFQPFRRRTTALRHKLKTSYDWPRYWQRIRESCRLGQSCFHPGEESDFKGIYTIASVMPTV